LTLPNILKEFNSNLYGYSINQYSTSTDKSSVFNVAEPGAMSRDTIHQAKNLVKRMRSDKKVNIAKHWKLITIMIGGNDFCLDVCYTNDQRKVVEKSGSDLLSVLRILKANLPRSLINVVLPPDVSILTRIKNRNHECKALHYFECPCMFSLNLAGTRQRTINTMQMWKQRTLDILKMPEFHTTVNKLYFLIEIYRKF
jgi:hypothetical protein